MSSVTYKAARQTVKCSQARNTSFLYPNLEEYVALARQFRPWSTKGPYHIVTNVHRIIIVITLFPCVFE